MHTAAYRWHVALTSAGGLYATLGALLTALGLVIWFFSDLDLPLADSLVAIVGVVILGLGATEVAAGWVLEQALPPDAPRKRPLYAGHRAGPPGAAHGHRAAAYRRDAGAAYPVRLHHGERTQ
ncbi:MAG: hypothetical protein WBF66_12265 [Dehalococcoidia bacterium]